MRGPKIEDEDTLLTKYHATESHTGGGSDNTASTASSPTEESSPASSTASSSSTSSSATWTYAEQTMPTYDLMLLARVLIGKIRNPARLETILRGVPVPVVPLTEKDRLNQKPGWNCVGWLQSALEALAEDSSATGRNSAMGKSSNLDWTAVRDAAMEYVEQKATEHRYDGLAPVGQFDLAKPATFDLVLGREVAP